MKIAVVVLDTLRKDAFDEHFDWLPGTRFESAWSVSHWTLPAHASLFTGRYPSEHGTHAESRSFDCPDTLAETLAAAGFTTRAFSANLFVSPAFGLDRGFEEFRGARSVKPALEEYFDWTDYGDRTASTLRNYYLAGRDLLLSDCRSLPSLREAVLNQLASAGLWTPTHAGLPTALEWVRETEHDDDEFLFFNFMEAHTPYHHLPEEYKTNPEFATPQEGLVENLSADGRARARTQYYDAVEFLSDRYRDLFDVLRTEMDYVVTVSDHGESLGDGGRWEHRAGLWPELTHVPLVVSGTAVDSEVRQTPVSLVDLHRTIGALADVDVDGRGRNLLESIDARDLLLESYEALEGDSVGPDGASREPLRGLVGQDGEYAFDTGDGYVGAGANEALRGRVRSIVETFDERSEGADGEDVSPHVERHLEHLGYQ